MRQLPFGARVSDEFIEHLKRETAKAKAESPEVFPCLWVEEATLRVSCGCGPQTTRMDFEKSTEITPVNRLALGTRPAPLIKERICVLFLAGALMSRKQHSISTVCNSTFLRRFRRS